MLEKLRKLLVDIPDSPRELGFKYDEWLQDQKEAIKALLESESRYDILNAGLGSGKSTIAMSVAELQPSERTCILTPTKPLQDQYAQDFPNAVLMKGRTEYECAIEPWKTAENAVCTQGYKCRIKKNGCPYYDAKRVASQAQVVVSNLAYFLTVFKHGGGLGKFDTVIIDEADLLEDWIMRMAEIVVQSSLVKRVLPRVNTPTTQRLRDWRRWAEDWIGGVKTKVDELEQLLEGFNLNEEEEMEEEEDDATGEDDPEDGSDVAENIPSPGTIRLLKESKQLLHILQAIIDIPSDERWVVEPPTPVRAEIKPVWAGPYAERYLYEHVGKQVILMSGTIPEGQVFARLMGFSEGDWNYHQFPCRFPVANRPHIFIPTVKVKRDMTKGDKVKLVDKIDRIIEDRLGRKGLICTANYWLAKFIWENSIWGGPDGLLITHEPGEAGEALELFKARDVPAVLVSPAVGRGTSLDEDLCRFVIHAKVPFPSMETAQMKARREEDKSYVPYVTAVSLEQASFRGMRGMDDVCESIILDTNWGWFSASSKSYFSQSFRAAWRRTNIVPEPINIPEIELEKAR